MRHGLLLTAVATVAVPGLLAMMAALGHEHGAAEDGVAAASLNASVTPSPELARITASQQATGMHLLDMAADASLSTSYQGTELISQSGVDGSVKMISQVWHQGGGSTLVETSSGTTSAVTQPADGSAASVASSDPASGSPEGVFGVTKTLVALLGKHYVAVYSGNGVAVSRPAVLVDLYSFDGFLATRYWLDKKTMVPLRRELFDSSDNVVSEDSFVQVQFGALAMPQTAATNAGTGVVASTAKKQTQSPAQPAWVSAAAPSRFLTSLTGQGWQVPGTLPGNLPLYAAASAMTTSGEIVDLEYSDGLYDVSLFVQRGTLAPDMTGWQQGNMDGEQVFVSGHSVTWAGSGFVYTMIADAPPQTMDQVVAALPHTGPPGVLDRLGRGFVRLAQLINPFN
jgi:sigma-E factor negative regulatory protein RseB